MFTSIRKRILYYPIFQKKFHGKGTEKGMKKRDQTKKKVNFSRKYHDTGQEYRCKRDYQKAIDCFKKSSRSSNKPNRYSANSLATLGFLYWKGEGVEKSDSKAIYYFKMASVQGHYGAMTKLGVVYLEKEDLESTKKAITWFKRASKQGCERSSWYLGMIHFYGYVGVQIDYDKAFLWLSKSAEAGYTETSTLAQMYFHGIFVERDIKQAIQYFTTSASAGDVESMHILGCIYHHGDNTGNVQVSIEKAIDWYTLAVEHGSKETWNLARIYFEGEGGIEADVELSLDLFLIAAYNECPVSQFQVGLMYFNGYGAIQQSLEVAIFWFKKVIEQELHIRTS